ncbi:MAG: hypothetical protein WBB82_02460 [Limnothrix sp.]
MTYSEEFQPGIEANNSEPVGYFEALGVQFTSTVLGILLAVAGIAGAGALWWFLVKPSVAENEVLAGELQQKESELQQKQAANSQNKIAELEAEFVKEQRIATSVLNSYGQEKQVQTFLLDLNRVLTASNVQLVSYEPTPPQPEFITDESYGLAAQNKLKRQTFNVAFEDMTYAQAESMLSRLDLLQPLVVLRNFSTEVSERQSYLYTPNELISKSPAQLSVVFVIDALIAPTAEEIEARQAELASGEGEAAAGGEEAPPQ